LKLLKRTICSGFFLSFLIPCLCWGWQGRVVSVAEGDTIIVLHEGKRERIRLYGVDCPEKGQQFDDNAKQFTSDLVLGKNVDVQQATLDEHGRMVGIVSVDGVVLNKELVKYGYAWVHKQSCTKRLCREWSQLEDEAKSKRLGLWILSVAIPPWEFRHFQSTIKSDEPGERSITIYHGDVTSHVFHAPKCDEFNCKNCIVVFRTREAAMRSGYKPCSRCNP